MTRNDGIVVEPTAKIRRAYRETTAAVRRLLGEAARNFYQIGRTLKEAREGALHRVGGYRTWEEYVRAEFGLSHDTATRFMVIAEQFNPDVARSLGLARIEAVVDYARATRKLEQAGELLGRRIGVPKGGRIVEKLMREAAPAEIRAAARRVRRARTSGGRPRRVLVEAVAALEARLAQIAGSQPAFRPRVTTWRARGGVELLTVSGVPVARAREFGRALAEWRGG